MSGYPQQMQQMQQPQQQQQYAPNQFMPGVQATGYPATPAATGMGSPMGVLASMAMSKQLGGIFGSSSSSSSSFSSASSKVSIVKYDDYFRKTQADWCLNNLVRVDGDPAMTADEIKANPPLGLKFKDCDLIIPIPNPTAMCATTQELLRQLMGNNYNGADDATKKRNAEELSKALLIQYVEDCGYGTGALAAGCQQGNMKSRIDDQTEPQANAFRAMRQAHQGTNPPGATADRSRNVRDIMRNYS